MIVRKTWKNSAGNLKQYKTGWFLFGILPLYIKAISIKGDQVDPDVLQSNLR